MTANSSLPLLVSNLVVECQISGIVSFVVRMRVVRRRRNGVVEVSDGDGFPSESLCC